MAVTPAFRFRPAPAAASAAALAAAVPVALSAPALARPLGPALVLVVLLPALAGFLLGGLFGRILRRRPRLAAALAALLVALPWAGVAAAGIARAPWAAVLGPLAAATVPLLPSSFRHVLVRLAVAAAVLLLRPAAELRPSDEAVRPVVVFGIDAATWPEIEPLLAAGELPNLAAFRAAGASGVLMSEEPTLSPRVWTIIATGQPTEVNGVVDFNSDRSMLRVGRFWDAAVAAGSAVGLMEWHITWPPDDLPGFGVPGWLARGFQTRPPEASFLKKLEAGGKARLPLFSREMLGAGFSALAVSAADHALANLAAAAEIVLGGLGEEDSYWRVKLIQARLQTDLYLELMQRERPGCSAIILYPVDSLGHNYWKYHEPEAFGPEAFAGVSDEERRARSEVVRDAYRECDRLLGRVLDRLDLERTTVMIVSDHGMKAAAEGGHLAGRVRARTLFELLGMKDRLNYSVAGKQLNISSAVGGEAGRRDLLEVHRLLSEAHVAGRPEVHPFLPQPFRPELGLVVVDYALREIQDPETVLVVAGREVKVADLFRAEDRSGDHRLEGVILIRGPEIAAGARIEDADLYDVAPTLLHLMGLEVPADLPGRVLTEAFRPEALAARPVRERPGGLPEPPPAVMPARAESETAGANLQELGYLDAGD
ncbi:MAG: hypothetical protein D6702_05970 [Planctomycetota bacterium]|nr:MAG: hypothetical protein D6702_05970 [Planctomycetota bacterium]